MSSPKILFTKSIVQTTDLQVDSCSFIRVIGIDFTLPSSLSQHYIFTSQNVVEKVCRKINIETTQSIYAVGQKTKDKLLFHKDFKNIKTPQEKENAEGLIQLFEEEKLDNFLYFCGKQRLPKLEQYFAENNKQYTAVEVYDTQLIQPDGLQVENYEWICFCSPSAVNSYLQKYRLLSHQKVLCIGETTANVAKQHTTSVHVSPRASVESMLIFLNEYYKK